MALAGRLPIVVIDPKGSPALAATVRAHGGQVWTLDGTLPADLLDPRPWQVPDLLLELRTTRPRHVPTATPPSSGRCGRPGRWRWTAGRWTWPSCAVGSIATS